MPVFSDTSSANTCLRLPLPDTLSHFSQIRAAEEPSRWQTFLLHPAHAHALAWLLVQNAAWRQAAPAWKGHLQLRARPER
eukprot:1159847-Pelagomonas_calceolata.AAC.4